MVPDTLATKVIAEVGPGGNYLGLGHTVQHYRRQFWIPGQLWDRSAWDAWRDPGASTMASRAAARLEGILARHEPQPMDEAMAREVDRVVAAARRELLG